MPTSFSNASKILKIDFPRRNLLLGLTAVLIAPRLSRVISEFGRIYANINKIRDALICTQGVSKMYEKHSEKLLPYPQFLKRMFFSGLIGLTMVAVSLAIGMYGYHRFEKMRWIDAFANASMILSGMGPFGPYATRYGKIFGGCYALFSGLTLIVIVSTIWAPIVHRFLHKFHLQADKK